MGIEGLNILSVGGFLFFLIIFLVGYIFVEVLFGEKYPFKNVLIKYNNSYFDRIIHYIFWGIFGNLVYFYTCIYSKILDHIVNIFNSSGKMAETIKFVGDTNSIQYIIFCLFYFFLLIATLFLFKWAIVFGNFTGEYLGNLTFNKKSKGK